MGKGHLTMNKPMMSNKDYIFLFDLDSTITKAEILPTIAKMVQKEEEIRRMTEDTMQGIIPFRQSFLSRVGILRDIEVATANQIVSEIPLNEGIVRFLKENRERCYVVTGNLDVWISGLIRQIGMEGHCFCSRAITIDGHIDKVVSVLDKRRTVEQFVQPLVAVGDGDNDTDMVLLADIGIGYGGVRPIAPSLMDNIDYAFYDDEELYRFLTELV